MRNKKLAGAEKDFVEQVKQMEERLFADKFDDTDAHRMKSDRYSWHYRPSHHVLSGLITKGDVMLLLQPGKRLLSIGAHPAFLEQILCTLGVPAENIVVADNDPAIEKIAGDIQKIVFDTNSKWPEIGTFDLIIFPESLCMCTGHTNRDSDDAAKGFPGDAKEAKLLANILMQSLDRLRPGGEIRANGPMSHPKVVKAAEEILTEKGYAAKIDYQRFFLTVSAMPH